MAHIMNNGLKTMHKTKNKEVIARRFWDKVDKDTDSGCWEWTGALDSPGYGRIKVGNKLDGAHRVSWIMHNGPIPKHDSYHGTCVLHKCDNRKCVRPDHLFLGVAKDNTQDMMQKGRRFQHPQKGESNGNSKLNDDIVLTIRKYAGALNNIKVATFYGVSPSTISDVIRRRTWKHI